MKKVIITTTINEPNEAIRDYDAMPDWDLIVVGDKNGPEEYALKRGKFLNWKQQEKEYSDLCALIGPRSTVRGRMIGFIEAHKAGADLVATIDDDNFPYLNWGHRISVGNLIDVMQWGGFCFEPLWAIDRNLHHRGFPVELLGGRHKAVWKEVELKPLLQANLWDGDPDVDAYLRLALRPRITVPEEWCLVAGEKFMPVNFQNTFISGKFLRDFCPLPFIGRHEDIWAGYIFQHLHPNSTVYGPATVRHEQSRTVSSLIADMENEVFGMKHGMEFLDCLSQFGPEEAIQNVCPYETLAGWRTYRKFFE